MCHDDVHHESVNEVSARIERHQSPTVAIRVFSSSTVGAPTDQLADI